MVKSVPTYEDARLILKLYELRREEKMRAAREWYARRFFPQSIEDVRAALAPANPESAYLRMIFGYWDMAASFVVRGVLNSELFFESAGEMIFVWAKIEPFIAALRAETKTPLLANVERALSAVPWVPERIRVLRERMPRLRDAAMSSR
jgi:hypothetical protein